MLILDGVGSTSGWRAKVERSAEQCSTHGKFGSSESCIMLTVCPLSVIAAPEVSGALNRTNKCALKTHEINGYTVPASVGFKSAAQVVAYLLSVWFLFVKVAYIVVIQRSRSLSY